jgi:hypothetical protein
MQAAAVLPRREMCWRVVEGSSGRLIVCAIYECADRRVELRLAEADRVLRSECLADARLARARAEEWLTAIRAAGCIAP